MTDKEILYQMLQREINSLLESAAPQFKIFSGAATKYIIDLVDPYVSAFLSPDDGSLNEKAASEFLKQETSEKINKFLKEFEEKQREQ
jgi:hypothetical protein